MRRTVALLIPAVLVAVIPALPAAAAPEPPSPGWAVAGDVIRWTASTPMPLSDAGVEFWEGDQLLGTARESSDLRTFTLTAPLKNPGALQVRSAGKRLDVTPPAPASLAVPRLPALWPEAAVDPGKPGPFATTKGEYSLDSIKLPEYPQPIEMEAVVVAPKGAPGKRPLALFLHGRHFTCYNPANPNQFTGNWPCPAGLKAVPSHRGYLKAQELLASQGYVTVSISANGINAQDANTVDAGAQGRSSLVRHHLAKWADWVGYGRTSAPAAVKDAPPADLSKVMLVGHSRGGEGVNRAATDSLNTPPGDTGFTGPVRWNIRGTVLIGPTIFGHNPQPDVPSVTFLPGCDGDVSDLQGQMFVDQTRGISRGAALHSALYVVGANHNFFNSEWTPGQAEAPAFDDFSPGQQPDPVCAPGTATRLTAGQQQAAGATYIAASARLFLSRDESVLPLLDGSGVRAPSADPARVLSHAVGGHRKPFVVPSPDTQASGSARVCAQVTTDAAASCGSRSPHLVRFRYATTQPERESVALKWTAAGQAGVIIPAKPVSLHGSKELALRLAVPANTPATRFGVSVTDQSGQKHSLGTVSVTGLPGTTRLSALWAQEVRVPLPTGLGHATSLELVPESAGGEALLIDAHGWNKGLPPVVPTRLGRVDATVISVDEGDSGTVTHNVAVTATGNGTRVVRLFYNDTKTNTPVTKLVTLKPGEHRVEVPITYTANTRWSADTRYPIGVTAIGNAVVGAAFGGLLVRNDDPIPKLSVTPVAESVVEGGTLRWKLTLSEAADSSFVLVGLPVAPGASELSTTDVDAQWFRENSGEEPSPSRPLSSTGLQVWVFIPAGQTSLDVDVPTVADTEVEGEEQVKLKFEGLSPTGTDFEVIGKVANAA
ncbi:alpha/beta hydrolase family protein [Lentzea nigeriaca]|uniref:hypothetical protein n=1 Tax=Lentzea nigeriaca TaxID=1128665 RepID=UPI00195863C0|nr:hypothetical protein [Lentzea nigeriaca]MBM7859373.1 hypothetical protein [Lentzea nigeriaca]